MKTNTSRGPWPQAAKKPEPTLPIDMIETQDKPSAKSARKPKATDKPPISVNGLRIANIPFPESRKFSGYKYDKTFEQMEVGDAIVCSIRELGPVSTAMRGWLDRTKREGVVRTARNTPKQGDGCIWWRASDK